MKVLVLGGGDSPEREVSQRSAKAVYDALIEAGIEAAQADPKEGMEIFNNLGQDTIVFPILHGKGGEDGSIQAEMEKRNIPFLGATSEVSSICFNKWDARQKFSDAGLNIAKGELVSETDYNNHPLTQKPHVLKVVRGGSSIGTLIVRQNGPASSEKAREIFSMEEQPLIEELIEGIEVTIPILDQSALPPIEVRPPEGGEFDYENKYNGKTAELCPPPSLSEDQVKKSQEIAEQVHKSVNCRHLSRVDLMMRPDGSFVVLEINTIPGLTNQSLYPKSAGVAGMSMPQLVTKFSDLVRRDYSL
jgi:D-alanine-D-alanine ligase